MFHDHQFDCEWDADADLDSFLFPEDEEGNATMCLPFSLTNASAAQQTSDSSSSSSITSSSPTLDNEVSFDSTSTASKTTAASGKIKSSTLSARQLRRLEHNRRIRSTFHRLVKNDTRRIFPAMYCNVVNSGEMNTLEAMIGQYMSPLCELRNNGPAEFGFPACRTGPLAFMEDFYQAVSSMPDYSLLLCGARVIRQLYEERSIVEFNVLARATKLILPQDNQEVSNSNNNTREDTQLIVVGPQSLQSVSIEFSLKFAFYFNKELHVVKVMVTPSPLSP
eukprot:scaffold7232_cov310-Ochromonas_danica.AAC.4